MRASLRIKREGKHYLLRLTQPQRDLVREALLFIRDSADGNIASLVRTGACRASLTQTWERLADGEVRLTVEEVHVLFSALAAVVVAIPSEQEFFTRIGFFREQAVSLANALTRDIASAGGSQ
ncbi:hypothetical protein [Streptomyces wuyuanensis]|uniref:hypothetical protein n=1 Tax=Streptomyces wuyuanensis TaxID=1196353 RepID=UPI003D732D19